MNTKQDQTNFYDLTLEDSALAAAINSPQWARGPDFSPALFTEERRDLAMVLKKLAVTSSELNRSNIKASTEDEKVMLAFEQALKSGVVPSGAGIRPVLEKLLTFKVRRHANASLVATHGEIQALTGAEIAEKMGESAIQIRESLDAESGVDAHDASDMSDVLANMIRRIENPGELIGLEFGMPQLEDAIDGLQPGRLVVIAGRPHQGKSTFMFNMNAALIEDGKRTMFFTLEMGKTEVKQATLDIICGETIRVGATPTKDEITAMREGIRKMQSFKWRIDDSSRLPIDRICNKARAEHSRNPLDALFVDYLQIISGSDATKGDPRIAMNEITAKLKALAKELHIPVITASQINRSMPKTNPETGKIIYGRPALSQMRESASIESDADVVISPHREPDDEGAEVEVRFDAVILKNRATGIIMDIPMTFNKYNRRMSCAF